MDTQSQPHPTPLQLGSHYPQTPGTPPPPPPPPQLSLRPQTQATERGPEASLWGVSLCQLSCCPRGGT